MKKGLALILSLTLLLSLAACSKSDEKSGSKKDTASKTEAGDDDGGETDVTEKNNKEAAVVLMPGELYQFDKDAEDGPVISGLSLAGNQLGSSELNSKDPDVKGIRCVFLLNEWVEFHLDTYVDEGIQVYVFKHSDDAAVYSEKKYSDDDESIFAECSLERPEEEDYQWGEFYLNPEYADPGVYDIVFVKGGKAVAVIEANFFAEESLGDISDEELSAMMKDF